EPTRRSLRRECHTSQLPRSQVQSRSRAEGDAVARGALPQAASNARHSRRVNPGDAAIRTSAFVASVERAKWRHAIPDAPSRVADEPGLSRTRAANGVKRRNHCRRPSMINRRDALRIAGAALMTGAFAPAEAKDKVKPMRV